MNSSGSGALHPRKSKHWGSDSFHRITYVPLSPNLAALHPDLFRSREPCSQAMTSLSPLTLPLEVPSIFMLDQYFPQSLIRLRLREDHSSGDGNLRRFSPSLTFIRAEEEAITREGIRASLPPTPPDEARLTQNAVGCLRVEP